MRGVRDFIHVDDCVVDRTLLKRDVTLFTRGRARAYLYLGSSIAEISEGSEIRRVMRANTHTSDRNILPEPVAHLFRAGEFLRFCLRHFETHLGPVNYFDARWEDGDNFRAFHRAASEQGDISPERDCDAATQTWTGKTLAEMGFEPRPLWVQRDYDPSLRLYPPVSARFKRMQE